MAQRGSSQYVEIPDDRDWRLWSQTLLNGVQWQDKRQWAQIKKKETPSEHKKLLFYCEGGQTLEQVAQRDCEDFIPGDVKSLSERGRGKPALTDAAWAARLDKMT